MRIIVAGIGEVGTHLAHMLAGGMDDIIAIDPLPENLERLESMADLVTIEGSAASIAVLKEAEIEKCDLFIAVAHYEE
ncbi:MAG: NAD-binding protein, partial [Bacteroides sp.]